MNKHLIVTSFALIIGLVGTAVSAQDRYISDELYVPMRSGMGTQYRITHRGLPSGTKLKLIEEHAEEGWSLVETPKGDQGWVRNQYLSAEPVAKLKLRSAQAEIAKLEKQRRALQQQATELQQQNANLKNQLNNTQVASSELDKELSTIKKISAGSIELHAQHQALIEEHQLLQTQADVLKAENDRLQADRTYREWLYGAGILILGVIVTLILQSMSKRKRYSEWA